MFTQKIQWTNAFFYIGLLMLPGCESDYLHTDTDQVNQSSDPIETTGSDTADTATEIDSLENNTDTEKAVGTDDTDTHEVVITTHLIENFDDGDITNELGGIWLTYDDQYDGGDSVVTPTSYFNDGVFTSEGPGYGGTGYAVHVSGTTGSVFGWDYLGLFSATGANTTCPDAQNPTMDFTQFTGIQFMAKGTTIPAGLHFKLPHKKTGPEDNCIHNDFTPDTLTDYNDFEYDFGAQVTADWQLIRIPFSEMERRSNPDGLTIEDVLTASKELIWEFQKSNAEVDLWLDDIAFYTEIK